MTVRSATESVVTVSAPDSALASRLALRPSTLTASVPIRISSLLSLSALQVGSLMRADGLADQGFGGEGKAVQSKGGDAKELREKLVGSEGGIAETGAEKDERGEAELQHKRAQEDVAAGGEHFRKGGAVGNAGAGGLEHRATGVAGEVQAKGGAGPFGDERGQGDAGDAPVQT